MSVLLGNGNGTFQAQQTFATGSDPRSVALADVNGDGKPDLVVANYGSNTVSVLLGNGNGTFQAQQTFATGSDPVSVAVGDVNGDGRPDLVVANFGSDTVSVLLNAGNGNFTGQVYTVDTTRSLRAVDQPHHAGRPGHQRQHGQLHRHLQRAGHRRRSHRFAAGDLTGTVGSDPHPGDAGRPVRGLHGDRQRHHRQRHAGPEPGGQRQHPRPGRQSPHRAECAAAFQAQQTFATGLDPHSVAVGDVNGDGKPDLVVANSRSNTVSVLLGNGNGTFQAAANLRHRFWARLRWRWAT